MILSWIIDFFRLFFPQTCAVCGGMLGEKENYVCVHCHAHLPRTYYYLEEENEVARLFWGKVPLTRAASYFYYSKGSDYCQILYQLKYHQCKEIGEVMGRCMAAEMQTSMFFSGIDLIVPVPLHKKKEHQRGYNQCEWIAKGVSGVTGIPVNTSGLIRDVYNPTQTKKSAYERWENVENVFSVIYPEEFAGKHILLIDDVLTTGATLCACASVLKELGKAEVSILTLAVSR